MYNSVDSNQVSALFCNDHLAAWRSSESLERIRLSDQNIDALAKAAIGSTDSNFQDIPLSDLSACADIVTQIKRSLFEGSGVAVVSRFPVESFERSVGRRASGILSNLIAPLMAQDIKGTLLYDVIDEGTQASNTTRRSKTNVEQPFHTDGPWFAVPPNVIALFCLQPATTGGFSQVSSLQQTLCSLIEQNKDRFGELMSTPVPWNRMGQFTSTESSYSELPLIESTTTGTLVRHYADYIRTGYELADDTIKDQLADLLTQIDAMLGENACKPFRLESGEFQFVNNWTVAHARAKFTDDETSDESPSGRHLVRLWNKPAQMQ